MILRRETLEKLSEDLGGGDLILLPSSIHEWIVLPGDADIEGSYMVQMVRSINQTVVEPEDRLSDHVYVWRTRTGLIELLEG